MQTVKTRFEGLIEIIPTLFHDNRGWFYEYYTEREFSKIGIKTRFVQDNQSFTCKGCIRGLHLQVPPAAPAKLVSVMSGITGDEVVGVRNASATFGRYYICVLHSEQHKMIYASVVFVIVLTAVEVTIFFYNF